MLEALGFFALVEAVGLAAVPLAGLAFARLPGAGLGFAKPLGLLLLTWAVWMAASLGLAPYGTATVLGAFGVLALAAVLVAARQRALAGRIEADGGWWARRRAEWAAARALPPRDPLRRRLWLGAEAMFAVGFAGMALLVAFSPDVWGTEKPMDMAFVTAINASTGFPPHDPWMAGADLNYYYLGHLALAMVVRLAGVAPDAGYNLALAALAGLSAAAVFTLAGTITASVRAGVAAVVVTLVLGNLAGAREWVEATDPPADYDWFAPSRVIEGAITEFPWFSFLLGDLHAHVLAIPFTLLALAFALQVVLAGPRGDAVWRGVAEALAAGLAIGALYAINSWSYPVAAGLLVLAVVSHGLRAYTVVWLALVLLASVVLLLPFWLEFDPAARGIGFVSEQAPFTAFAGDQILVYGVLAWPLTAAFAARVLATRRPLRTAVWSAVAAIFAGSLLAPADLAGVAAVTALAAVAVGALMSPRLERAERFVWLLVAGGLICVLVPELVYVRDSFAGGRLYRMNTVFKLGYQAWLLLAVAAACALVAAAGWLPRRAWPVWAVGTAVVLLLGAVYPYAGTWARKDGFARTPTLDGLGWLRVRGPGDPAAIAWLRANTPGSAVVLEAVGEDYSAFGHARISTFTGRATVLGWPGHELQWGHDPGSREADVRTLYTTASPVTARALIGRYGIDYVVFGPIERTTYGDRGRDKWDALGERVFERAGTTVWRVSPTA